MPRKHLHWTVPRVGDLVHPMVHDMDSDMIYTDTDRVGLVVETMGLEVLVQFGKDYDGQPHREWYARTRCILVENVKDI